jgi:integrase
LQASELDELYEELSEKISPTLATSVHQVLVACLGTALRTRKLVRNPIVELAKVPERGKVNHGQALDDTQLQTLVQGFKGTTLYPVVAVAAFTGARRNEILSLRWEDLNITEGTLRIARTLEETLAYGLRTKEPKSERGKRVVRIDDRLLALLFEERERHLRVAAGLPDGTQADLSLIKLPAGALMFPNPPPPGESFPSPGSAMPASSRRHSSARQRRLVSPGCGSTICGAATRRCCSIAAFRCTWLPRAAATIRQYF